MSEQENKNPTFKIDNKVVKVGQDMRVEIEFPDDQYLTVILTHEGIICDAFRGDENVGTSSITFAEKFDEMTED